MKKISSFGTVLCYGSLLLIWLAIAENFEATLDSIGTDSLLTILLVCMLGFLFSTYTGLVIHEAGHMVCGLLTGYRFSSFRIGKNMLLKQDGKWTVKKYSVAGTGGQCLMAPPEPDEDGKIPFILYNLGGVLAGLLCSAVYFLLYKAFPEKEVGLFFISCFFFTVYLALTNLIPMYAGGVANDGMNIVQLCLDDKAVDAFRKQMDIAAAQGRGMRIKDMPEEWFEIPDEDKLDNTLIATIAVFRASRYTDSLDIEKSISLSKELIENNNGVLPLHKSQLACDLLTMLALSGRKEEAAKLVTPAMFKFWGVMRTQPSIQRTMYCYYTLVKKDEQKKAEECLRLFNKYCETHPYEGDVIGERELMALIDERK